MAHALSLWQKLQSTIYPVSIRKGSSPLNPELELFYFRGRYLLATRDAVYSDGNKYRPLTQAFRTRELARALPDIRQVLVLGTGLASAAHILAGKGFFPATTFVEIDELVLDWAIEFIPADFRSGARFIHEDAFRFIQSDTERYDLVIIDIFFGRNVPELVLESDFLAQCAARLRTNGFLVLNYMEHLQEKPGRAADCLRKHFANLHEVSFGVNKVYVASGVKGGAS